MNLDGYSNKDKKIIKNNKDKTPHELLSLGLSAPAFERMTAFLDTQKMDIQEEKSKKVVPIYQKEPEQVEIAKPIIKKVDEIAKPKVKLTSPVEYNRKPQGTKNGQVKVLNNRSGKTSLMAESFALKLVKGSTSNEYKIL